jgi:actin-related protein
MQTLNKKTVTEYYEWVKSLPNEIQQKIKLRNKETICERTILSLDKKRTIASLDTDGKIYDTRLFKNVIDDEFVKKLNEETYNKYKFILNKENYTIEVYIKNSYVGLLFETTECKSLRFVNSNDEEVLIHKCRNYANVA